MSNSEDWLPEHLHAAYDWTDMASELDELRALTGAELDAYCKKSAANSADKEVTEHKLRELSDWLRATYSDTNTYAVVDVAPGYTGPATVTAIRTDPRDAGSPTLAQSMETLHPGSAWVFLELEADEEVSIGDTVIVDEGGNATVEAFTWTLTIKVTATHDIVADGFNPTDPEKDRSPSDILRHIITQQTYFGEHDIRLELERAEGPLLKRILRVQGYSDEEIATKVRS